MSLIVREAIEQDLPSILSLYAQPDMDDGNTLSAEQAAVIFRRMQSYPNYHVYVAVSEDSEIVGTYALAVMDNLAHEGTPSGLIEDVVVKSAWQGKGVGKQMIAHAMALCREAGCYKAALSSNKKREKAHEFYEKLGFEKHGYSFRISIE